MEALYGRAQVIERACASVDSACGGDGRLLLFTGEPGIGKSTLVEHVAADAVAKGARVAWGRCWEAGGAPAYWPWIQIFRGLHMDDDPFARAMPDVAAGASEARFAAFDRAVRALKDRATPAPLALVFDDLHAADAPSLLLLLLLARQLRGTPLLVVGAYRDAEARRTPEIALLLAKLVRESEVLPLAPLAPEDVATWVRDVVTAASVGEAAEIYRLTEGHPLFVVEALRLGRPGESPAYLRGGLGAVLDEHLTRLSASTRAVLEVAAVLGRDFSIVDVAAIASMATDAVHDALREAMATSVVVPTDDRERFRFSHVLLRDRLEAELKPSTRATLHARAGATLLARGESALRAAVHHLFEGQSAGNTASIAEVAAAAAEVSVSRLAFEEAAQIARRALVLPRGGSPPDRLECRLKLALAESLILLGEANEGKSLCIEVGELAERLRESELLGRAALVYGTELASGALDDSMISLLRRALARQDDGDSPLRARLLVRLSAALTPPKGPESRPEILDLMRSAMAMARRLGDRHVLLYVLQFSATVGLLVPEQERFSFIEETVKRATMLDQRLVLLQTLPAYITALLARGQHADAEGMLPRYRELLAESRQPIHRVQWNLVHALFAVLRGDAAEADRFNDEARRVALQGGSDSGVRLWLGQRLSFAILRATPELIVKEAAAIVAQFETNSSGTTFAAWALAVMGRHRDAAALLRTVDLSPQSVPSSNLMEMLGAAATISLLGDTELAQSLYPNLVRAADRMFWFVGPGALLGPIARTLGDLAHMIGRLPEAVRHYDEAIAFCEALGAPPLVELCRASRAAALAQTSANVSAEVSAPRKPAGESALAPLELRREGDLWAISSPGGVTVRLKHSKGLGYLRVLMDQAGRDVHVLELVGAPHQAGDAGPMLDVRAKAEYRRRLDDLREDLAEAERFGDAARGHRIEAEIEAIAEQLAGAIGLGGRDRVAASTVERARVNVQRCLKEAIERISAVDPALGRYLSLAVKSGTYCSYLPL